MGHPVEVVEDPERARVLLHPARRELLEYLEEPKSAAELSRVLSLPRQRINYHLRELEKVGLTEIVDEKKQGSVVEKTYRRKSRRYLISTEALGQLGLRADEFQDRFSSAYQIALGSRTVDEVGRLRAGADAAGKKLPTFGLESLVCFGSPKARQEFAEELTDLVRDLVGKYHQGEGREYRLYLGAYPKPKE